MDTQEILPQMTVALCPPNPKLLFIATFTDICRGWLGV